VSLLILDQWKAIFGAEPVWSDADPEVEVSLFRPALPVMLEPGSEVLVTAGASRRPMNAPPEQPALIEYLMVLPAAWRELYGEDPAALFAVDTLRVIANYPHRSGAWLGQGHTLPAGRPIHPTTEMNGWVLTNALIFEQQPELSVGGNPVAPLLLTPLYPLELSLARGQGTDALMDRLFRMVGALQQDWSFFLLPERPDTVGGNTFFV